MKPIELAVPNLTAFFRMSRKAFQAAAQKFFPVRAIYGIGIRIGGDKGRL